jgi:hypothetical protein
LDTECVDTRGNRAAQQIGVCRQHEIVCGASPNCLDAKAVFSGGTDYVYGAADCLGERGERIQTIGFFTARGKD